jgi:hypothetical protein
MSQPRDPQRAPSDLAPRRPYAAPVLRTYGALRALTASGTGMVTETMTSNQPTKKMA